MIFYLIVIILLLLIVAVFGLALGMTIISIFVYSLIITSNVGTILKHKDKIDGFISPFISKFKTKIGMTESSVEQPPAISSVVPPPPIGGMSNLSTFNTKLDDYADKLSKRFSGIPPYNPQPVSVNNIVYRTSSMQDINAAHKKYALDKTYENLFKGDIEFYGNSRLNPF